MVTAYSEFVKGGATKIIGYPALFANADSAKNARLAGKTRLERMEEIALRFFSFTQNLGEEPSFKDVSVSLVVLTESKTNRRLVCCQPVALFLVLQESFPCRRST